MALVTNSSQVAQYWEGNQATYDGISKDAHTIYAIDPTGITMQGFIPGGGLSGDFLVKNSDDSYDTRWVSTSLLGSLPTAGGTMTGDLTILKDKPRLIMERAISGTNPLIGIQIRDNGALKGFIGYDLDNDVPIVSVDAGATYKSILHTGNTDNYAHNPVQYANPLDANTVLQPFTLCNQNIPGGLSFAYVITLFYNAVSTSNNRGQIAFTYTGASPVICTRNYYGGVWSPWRGLDDFFSVGGDTITGDIEFVDNTNERHIFFNKVASTNNAGIFYNASLGMIGMYDYANSHSIFKYTQATNEFILGNDATAKIGFFGATPVVKPSAMTQTYSTADATLAAQTAAAITNSTGGTVSTTFAAITAGTSYAQADMTATKNALASAADQINKLRNDHVDLAQFVNSLVDKLQALGLIG